MLCRGIRAVEYKKGHRCFDLEIDLHGFTPHFSLAIVAKAVEIIAAPKITQSAMYAGPIIQESRSYNNQVNFSSANFMEGDYAKDPMPKASYSVPYSMRDVRSPVQESDGVNIQ